MRGAFFLCMLFLLSAWSVPALAEKTPPRVCGKYDCANGTTLLLPRDHVWEEGIYSVVVTIDSRRSVCRGEISLETCTSPQTMFSCEGAAEASVDVRGCPPKLWSEFAQEDHHDHEHDHEGHGHKYEEAENPILYEEAQDRPYIERIIIMDAGKRVDLKIAQPEKVFLNFHRSETIYSETLYPEYKLHYPNGPDCPRVCRYGDFEVKEF